VGKSKSVLIYGYRFVFSWTDRTAIWLSGRAEPSDVDDDCGLDRRELLLDRSRKTCRCVDESVQGFAGACRRNQAEENDRPKHEANHGRVYLPNQRSS
jgi:hypothetical protein